MTTRRGLLAAAGIAFCGCCLRGPARAQGAAPSPGQGTAPARRPVTVAGKRVKTVDTHAHCIFADALALLGTNAQAAVPATKGVEEHFLAVPGAVEARLRAMDDMGVDMEILSINPFWYAADRDLAARIVGLNNDHLAELCAAHPDRFGAFASLTMQFPDLAVKQLEDAVRKGGLKGAAIGGSVLGDSFSEPKYRPILAKAEELGAVLFIHPQSVPELARRFAGNGWLANTIGNPLDTTIALQHLIYEGTLDRFPGLKVLAAHGGGYLGSYAPRSDHACFVSPQNCNPGVALKKAPTEYLNQLYFDSLVFTPEALRHLVAQVGAGQVVLGTDFPIPWELHPADHVLATTTLSDDDKLAILGGNAARLFGLTS